jgi:hypothetical protein
MKFEKNTELDQANLRIIIASMRHGYIAVLGFLPGQRFATYLPVVVYIALFLLLSIGCARPLRAGLGITRRGGFSAWSTITPAPVSAWCSGEGGVAAVRGDHLGQPGQRHALWLALPGDRHRVGAAGVAGGVSLTPYWQAQPYMVLMLMLTSTVIPFYAHLLLERTRKASEEAVAATWKSRVSSPRPATTAPADSLHRPVHRACLREAPLTDEASRLVDSIDRSLLNVSQLFRSILDLYTLDNGLQPALEVFNLGEWLADLLRQNAEAARWAGVHAPGAQPALDAGDPAHWRPWCRTCCPTPSSTARNARC